MRSLKATTVNRFAKYRAYYMKNAKIIVAVNVEYC
jgi:hypothetical protein